VAALLILALLALRTIVNVTTGHRLSSAVDEIEQRWGPLRLSALAPPPVDDARNRAKLVRAASEALVVEEEDRTFLREFLRASERSEAQRETLSAMVDHNRLAFEILDASFERPETNWEIRYEEGITADVPPLLDIVYLARLNAADALLRLDEQGAHAAARSVVRGLALAESLSAEPILIGQLVRIAIFREHVAVIREILTRAEPDVATLETLGRALEPSGTSKGIHLGLRGELGFTFEVLQAIDRGQHQGEVDTIWLVQTGLFRWLWRPLLREDMRFSLLHLDGVLGCQLLPPHRRRAECADDPFRAAPGFFHLVSRSSIPDLRGAVLRGDLQEAQLVLARTALALRRSRLDLGSYPDALSDLVPDHLAEPPVDPFTGEPPEYRRREGGFLLRSAADDPEYQLPKGLDKLTLWEIPR
jgi:hypothetical protein